MDDVIKMKGWRLWLLWTLACILGCVAGIAGGLAAREVLNEALAALVIGLGIGLAQWLVLRRLFRPAAWWIATSVLGVGMAFAAFDLTSLFFLGDGPFLGFNLLVFLLIGVLTGLAQWLPLRERVRRAGWWVLSSTLCWLAGGMLSLINVGLSGWALFLVWYAAIGLIVGAGTGVTLVLLWKAPALAERKPGLAGRLTFTGCALLLVLASGGKEYLGSRGIAAPDLTSRPLCNALPPLECAGDEAYCSQIVFFEPVEGPGYLNYTENGEDADDQYRSYLRRELMMAVKYATASVACETQDWSYPAPPVILGLGDMSEADGSIPGTSTGSPGHPMGTHEGGLDIDVAYYKAGLQILGMTILPQEHEGNLLGAVCKHTLFGVDAFHCTETPNILDPWRTALFIARMVEYPRLRVVGVDGLVGSPVEAALDALTEAGWIDPDLRASIPLAYEPTDQGRGFFKFHHHHLHISFNAQ